MNPLARKARRFHALRVQDGFEAAARAMAFSLRNSFVYRWRKLRPAGGSARHAGNVARLPDNDRYAAASFMPSGQPADAAVRPGSVAVVIPVYGDAALTRACLQSVLRAPSPAVAEVIVVDDASPEPEVRACIDELERGGAIRVLRNKSNHGFVASVNLGMRAAGDRDVILLNSDTVVAGDWADRLAAHAAGEKVGTVTPFSNNATICSYPRVGGTGGLPACESPESMDEAFSSANAGRACVIPTGVGFCMFISRACLRDVGEFDEEAFGRGYGEESDFCRRARARGWRHLLAADAFVWHRGEASFRGDAAALQQGALDLVERRHPGYLAEVARHVEKDPARPWRVAATAARFRRGERPVVLVVMHAHGTGTEKHVVELIERFRDDVRFLMLRATFEGPLRLTSADAEDGLDVRWRVHGSGADLVDLVASFGVRRVHVHHTLGLPLSARDLIRRLEVPFDFTVHDFYAICPRVRLATPDHLYCGGPEEGRCARCLSRLPGGGVRSIGEWQARNAWSLKEAERVICPSADAAGHVAPFVGSSTKLVVAPHDTLRHLASPEPSVRAVTPGERLRVAVLGVLSDDKGAATVGAVLRRFREVPDAPAVTLVGHVPPEYMRSVRGTSLRQTGPYEPADLGRLLREVDPHVVWFPAHWPETYSYTLSEAMQARLPVVAPDVGAFTERLASREWSWVVPWDLSAEEWVGAFANVREQLSRGEWGGLSFAARGGAPVEGRYPVAPDPRFYDEAYLGAVTPRGRDA